MNIKRITLGILSATITLNCTFNMAWASDQKDIEAQAKWALQVAHDYVDANGSKGALLDVDRATGQIIGYQLVGTSTQILICEDLVVARTNFLTASGEYIVGNFVLNVKPENGVVAYQSFGQDQSLLRFNRLNCTNQNDSVASLRLNTFP